MKVRVLLAAFFCLFLVSEHAFSQFHPEVTLGVQYWYSTMNIGIKGLNWVKADPVHRVGPYFGIGIWKVKFMATPFFGYMSLDYGRNIAFADTAGKINYYAENENFTLNDRLIDFNASLAYEIVPRMNLFFAVKNVSFETMKVFNVFDEYYFYSNAMYTIERKERLYGGGVSGISKWLRLPFSFFWSGVYLQGIQRISEIYQVSHQEGVVGKGNYNVRLVEITAGLGYEIGSGVVLMLGYRGDFRSGEAGSQNTHGFLVRTIFLVQ